MAFFSLKLVWSGKLECLESLRGLLLRLLLSNDQGGATMHRIFLANLRDIRATRNASVESQSPKNELSVERKEHIRAPRVCQQP